MVQGVSEVDEGAFSVDKSVSDARKAPLKQMMWKRAPLRRRRAALTDCECILNIVSASAPTKSHEITPLLGTTFSDSYH